MALEEHQEHEDQTSKDSQDHDDVKDHDMKAFNRDAHQENADGDLARDGSEAIGDLAEPPVSHRNDGIFGFQMLKLVSCAIERASDHHAAEHAI